MREVKGFFRELNGKRVWVPQHEDSRAAAKPVQEVPKAPKNLKPLVMPPAQPLKSGEAAKPPHAKFMKWGAQVPHEHKPTSSTTYYDPNHGKPKAPKPPPLPDSHYHNLGMVPPAKKEWPKLPELTPEEKLAKFLKSNPNAKLHPKPDEKGGAFYIKHPSEATGKDAWTDPTAIATFLPGGDAPKMLNGVPLEPWADHPTTEDGWMSVEGQDHNLHEPEFDASKDAAAGVVIEEPDGRVWVIHPSNGFGGYSGTFPKGHVDGDDSLQASAIREAFEESGLKVEITGFLGDVERTTTTARYYTAKRVGGTPVDCGWETQAVALVPRSLLYHALNHPNDHGLAEALGAGPKPIPPKPKWDPLPAPMLDDGNNKGSWW